MAAPREYEFNIYAATPDGDVTGPVRIDRLVCFDEAAARSVARKLARAEQAPIDLARTGPSPWADRYVGTASPKYPHSPCKVTVFERLD